MIKNNDYKKGVAYLLRHCKEKGINIRKYGWIIPLSYALSKRRNCHKFWSCSIEQGRLTKSRLSSIKKVYQVFHGVDTCLFLWDQTKEGFGFWAKIEKELFVDKVNEYPPSHNTMSLNEYYGVKEIQWFKRQ